MNHSSVESLIRWIINQLYHC